MSAATWTKADQLRLEELAASGVSASVAGQQLGVSRNAILGRAFRTGVSFHGKQPARPVKPPKPRAQRPPKVLGPRRGHRGRMKGEYIKPRALILQVLALHLAGVSRPKAATAFGVSKASISNVWRKDPVLMAEAGAIAERALTEARAAAQIRCAQKAARDAERKASIERVNAAVFQGLSPRTVSILRAYAKHRNMAAVGDAFGLSRQRIAQIVRRAEAGGYIAPVAVVSTHRGHAKRRAA